MPATRSKKKSVKAKPKLKTVVISRRKWLRGANPRTSLWDPKLQGGCCLGHVLHQAHRHSWASMSGDGDPEDYFLGLAARGKVCKSLPLVEYKGRGPYHGQHIYRNTDGTGKAIEINDHPDLTDKERERKLKPVLKKMGYKVKFVD